MNKNIALTSSKEVYNFCKPYVIAEIGANHNGDIDLAKRMIDSAKSCGADAVKFQSWTPKSLIAKEEYDRNQSYDDGDGGKKHFGSLKEMVEKYYLTREDHFELKAYCDKISVDFCSSPFSNEEVDLLVELDVPFLKIASMDINNFSLLRYMAKTQKTILLSTGMSTLGEIEAAVRIIEAEGNRNIILLHCISIYPPKYKDINLNNIPMLQKAFKYPVGFSDHSVGTSIPLASIVLGACVVEKHFTLDKNLAGWDHQISADPIELKAICQEGANISEALGSFYRIVSEDELGKIEKFRRSVVAAKDLREGNVIMEGDLLFKRPGTGISPSEAKYVLGRTLKIDLNQDDIINWDNLV